MPWPKGKPRPPSSGRKPGSKNKASATREALIAASGLTPLEYMLKMLRNPKASVARRMWAAQQAAPFVHPRLASTQLSTPPGQPLEHQHTYGTHELLEDYYRRAGAAHAARGVLETAAPAGDSDVGEGDPTG